MAFVLEGVTLAEPLSTHPIAICVLGQFRLLSRQEPVSLRHGSKSVELLGLLAIHSTRGLAREALFEVLWPESNINLAAQSLNNLVYGLHKLLGGSIGGAMPVLHDDGQYRLNLEAGLGVDITSFDLLASRGDRLAGHDPAQAAQLYADAVQLYHGDLCVGNDLHAIVERERLRARFLTLLVKLAEFEFEREDYGACLDYAQRLIQYDPCREDAHRLVMRCFVRQGMRTQALRQFTLVTHLLQLEFNTGPEPQTRELYDRIRLDPNSLY